MARYDLQLTDEEFWRFTHRDLYALYRHHEQAQQRREWCFGILAATIANFSLGAPAKMLEPWDFGLAARPDGDATDGADSDYEAVNALRAWARTAAGLPIVVAKESDAYVDGASDNRH